MVVERLPTGAELSMAVVWVASLTAMSWTVVLTANLLMVVPVTLRLVRSAPSRRYCAQ
jgi:hypothetical protein